jgi:hypothetical protein
MSGNVTVQYGSVLVKGADGRPLPETGGSSSGFGHVTTSPGGLARIRQEAALGATAVTFTWSAPGVSSVKLSIASEAAGTAELPAAVAYCIDPPNDAVRDAWITAGDSNSNDSQLLIAFADKENETLVFTSPITKLGLKRLWGSQALTAIAVGTEVAT